MKLRNKNNRIEATIKKLQNKVLYQDINCYIDTKIGYTMDFLKNKYKLPVLKIRHLISYIRGKRKIPYSFMSQNNKKYDKFESEIETYRLKNIYDICEDLKTDPATVSCFYYYYYGKNKTLF